MTSQLVLASKFLLISLAVFHPFAGLLYEYFSDVNDPFFIRILFSVYCLGALLLILTSRKVKRYHWRISKVTFVLLGLHLFYLTWLNELQPIYFATIPIFVVSAPIFFTRYKLLIPFLGFIVFMAIVSGSYYDWNELSIFFFTLVGLSLPVSFFNLFLFRRVIKKLQFSDYVLNNIDAIVLASNEKGEVTFVSKNINRILGYSRHEVIKRGWWNIRMNKVISDDELMTFKTHIIDRADREDGYDSMVLTKDGQKKWFHWKIVSLGKKSKVGVGQEITRKKMIEDEHKKLSLIAQQTDNLVMLIDRDNRIEWVNQGFTKSTGISAEAIENQSTDFIIAPNIEDYVIFRDTIEAVYADREMHYAELQFKKADDSTFWVNFNFTPIIEEGEVARVICIGRDSTTTKKAEDQIKLYSERMETLHQFDQQIFQAESLEDIFHEISKNIKGFGLECNRVSIAIYELEENYVKVISRNPNLPDKDVEIDQFDIKDFVRSIETLKNAEFVLNDLETAKDEDLTPTQRYLYKNKNIGAYISLPIKYRYELIGSLNFGTTNVDNFNQDTIEFLKEISSDVALAVYQFQLKEAIKTKNEKLQQRNTDITDSINYAERIQKAFLPSDQSLEEYFDDSFVLFKPKDTLSGDFYWVEDTHDALWIAVADCTGHGVPGALVSMVGTNILNQAIYEKKYKTPDEVLAYLNLKVIRTFSGHKGVHVNDAMDIGVCCIRKSENILLYAGVLLDLMMIRDGELYNFKSSRSPIGINPERVFMDFEMHRIDIIEDDQFYLISDGFTDQFGGKNNKKYGKQNFKKLLKDIAEYPMAEQCRIANNSFELWKKDEEQTDDIVFLGFKVR